ncbi:MAG: DUF2065 domain-containing protein [Nitratireductor sp.]|nr:DUF2065 domain-containing protein [Nitratireductor sp.]
MPGEGSPVHELIIAAGLFFVLEGLIYALFPNGVKRLAVELLSMQEQHLRMAGVAGIAAGVFIVWLAKHFG